MHDLRHVKFSYSSAVRLFFSFCAAQKFFIDKRIYANNMFGEKGKQASERASESKTRCFSERERSFVGFAYFFRRFPCTGWLCITREKKKWQSTCIGNKNGIHQNRFLRVGLLLEGSKLHHSMIAWPGVERGMERIGDDWSAFAMISRMHHDSNLSPSSIETSFAFWGPSNQPGIDRFPPKIVSSVWETFSLHKSAQSSFAVVKLLLGLRLEDLLLLSVVRGVWKVGANPDRSLW